jgi:hypothetical protein
MSTKTLRKRIALVALSALAAGSLSIASAPVANSALTAGTTSNSSTGLVGAIAGSGTTKTAVLLATGTLRLAVDSSAITVSAGARITSGSDLAEINAAQTCYDGGTSVAITPTGAAGTTFTVTENTGTSCAAALGAAQEVITVTIAASSLAGVANAGESTVRWDSNDSGAPSATDDAAYASTTAGLPLYLYIGVADAYGQAIASDGGALIVTASSGAILGTIAASSSGTPVAGQSVSVLTTDPSGVWVQVAESTVGAGWVGTVNVSYNGVVLATKSGKITGAPASLVISAKKVGTNAGTSTDAIGYQVKDAAGNNVVVSRSAILFDSSTNSAMLGAVAAGTADNTTSAEGNITPTCTASSSFYGTANLVLKHTLSNGTTIKSNSLPFTCGGNAVSYTASWDKATYAQGDVATLTVQFKDSKGGTANSYGIVSDATTADQAITANQMERVTAHTTSKTPSASGTVVYTFTVGTSTGIVPGKYNAVVSFPTTNTAGAALGTANVSVGYEILASGAVSNADVLKSIVSLIASINKQIQALQKLILRR